MSDDVWYICFCQFLWGLEYYQDFLCSKWYLGWKSWTLTFALGWFPVSPCFTLLMWGLGLIIRSHQSKKGSRALPSFRNSSQHLFLSFFLSFFCDLGMVRRFRCHAQQHVWPSKSRAFATSLVVWKSSPQSSNASRLIRVFSARDYEADTPQIFKQSLVLKALVDILSTAGPRKWWCGASNHQRQARFQTWRRLGSCEGCLMLICQTVGVQCIDSRTMPDNMEDLLVVRPQVLRSVKKQRAEAPTRSIWHRPVVLSSRLRRIGTPASHREWWSARLRRVEFCQEQGSIFEHMSILQIHKMILMTLAASRSLRCIPPASNRPLYFRIVKQQICLQRIYVGSNVFDFHTFTIIHRMFETVATSTSNSEGG